MRSALARMTLSLSIAAAFAFAAPPASAVQVVQESTGTPCSQKVSEDDVSGKIVLTTLATQVACPVRLETVGHEEFGAAFGAMVLCRMHWEGWASEAGEFIGTYNVEGCEQSGISPCLAPDKHAHFEILGGTGPSWTGELLKCMQVFGLTIRCHVPITLNELANHNYNIVRVHATPCENSPANSFDGTFTFVNDAAHPKIELK